MFFKRANLVDKQLLHLGLSNYKRMERNLEFRKKTLVIIQKQIIQSLIQKRVLLL